MDITDVEKAKALLKGDITLAAVKGDKVLLSRASGISPMLDHLLAKEDLSGFSAADKIVGKAAAMLFSKAGIKEVYAEVLSVSGADYLRRAGIPFSFGVTVDKIINRTGDDICPMEKTVADTEDVDEAFEALLKTRERLRGE